MKSSRYLSECFPYLTVLYIGIVKSVLLISNLFFAVKGWGVADAFITFGQLLWKPPIHSNNNDSKND